MDILKKLFPLSFKMTGSVANLIIGTIIYLVAEIIVGVVLGLLGAIPVVGVIVSLVGAQIGRAHV